MRLRICTYNVCLHIYGLHQNYCNNFKLERLEKIIQWLREQNFDIICLQEVFYSPAQRRLRKEFCQSYSILSPKSYYCGLYNSGLMTLIRKDINILEIEEKQYQTQGNYFARMFPRTCQVIKFESENIITTVANTHLTSPEFYSNCEAHDYYARRQLKEVLPLADIIAGDLNLDQLVDLDEKRQCSLFTQPTLNLRSFLVTKFTKNQKDSGHKDYILVPTDYECQFELSHVGESDHFPVIATINPKVPVASV